MKKLRLSEIPMMSVQALQVAGAAAMNVLRIPPVVVATREDKIFSLPSQW